MHHPTNLAPTAHPAAAAAAPSHTLLLPCLEKTLLPETFRRKLHIHVCLHAEMECIGVQRMHLAWLEAAASPSGMSGAVERMFVQNRLTWMNLHVCDPAIAWAA